MKLIIFIICFIISSVYCTVFSVYCDKTNAKLLLYTCRLSLLVATVKAMKRGKNILYFVCYLCPIISINWFLFVSYSSAYDENENNDTIEVCYITYIWSMYDCMYVRRYIHVHVRTYIHFRRNIKSKLQLALLQFIVSDILADIFGKQDGTTKETGLIDSEDPTEFRMRLEQCKTIWNGRELPY